MKKIIVVVFFFSTSCLMGSLSEELYRECIEHHAAETARAFITFANRKINSDNDKDVVEVSASLFLEFLHEVAIQMLFGNPSERKETRSVSTPPFKTPRSPHPLILALIPAMTVLHTFKDEKNKQMLVTLFCEKVRDELSPYARSSTPAGHFRPLLPH